MKFSNLFYKLFAFNLLFLNSCLNNFDSIKIEDCSRDQEFYLDKNKIHPYKCVVKLKGMIDDRAKVNDFIIGPGKVDTLLYNGDWYDNPFKIEYKALNSTRGEITILYKFY